MTKLYQAFFSGELIWVVTVITVLMFGFSLVWVIFMITRIPADYFLTTDEPHFSDQPFFIRYPLICAKNLIGGILLTAGIIMLFTPGQGVLTMVMGLALMDFPGKRRLEIWILRKKKIQDSMNWIRRKKDFPILKYHDLLSGHHFRRGLVYLHFFYGDLSAS